MSKRNGLTASESFGLLAIIGIIALSGAAAYGWVHNIITLMHADSFGGVEIVRAIGIFVAPLGAVLGFI